MIDKFRQWYIVYEVDGVNNIIYMNEAFNEVQRTDIDKEEYLTFTHFGKKIPMMPNALSISIYHIIKMCDDIKYINDFGIFKIINMFGYDETEYQSILIEFDIDDRYGKEYEQ